MLSRVLSFALLAVIISSISARSVSNQDEFINWGNVNLGCTLKCGAYWACFAKNFENPGACSQPSGCECNKFAEEEDLGLGKKLKKFGKKVGKVAKKAGKVVDKAGQLYGKYQQYAGMFGAEEDEFINWGNVNLGCTIKCGAYWTCFAKNWENPGACSQPDGCECNKFAEEEDLGLGKKLKKFGKKVGKVAKKAGELYGKYQQYAGMLGDEDLKKKKKINWKKIWGGIEKAIDIYNQVRPLIGKDDDEKFDFGSALGKVERGLEIINAISPFLRDEDELNWAELARPAVMPYLPTFARDEDQFPWIPILTTVLPHVLNRVGKDEDQFPWIPILTTVLPHVLKKTGRDEDQFPWATILPIVLPEVIKRLDEEDLHRPTKFIKPRRCGRKGRKVPKFPKFPKFPKKRFGKKFGKKFTKKVEKVAEVPAEN